MEEGNDVTERNFLSFLNDLFGWHLKLHVLRVILTTLPHSNMEQMIAGVYNNLFSQHARLDHGYQICA